MVRFLSICDYLFISIQPLHTQPKIYLLQVKTHKLSIHLTLPPTATLAKLKQEVYDALTSSVVKPVTRFKDSNSMDEDIDEPSRYMDTGLPATEADVVPHVMSSEDFELCKSIKEKGRMTGELRVIDADGTELKLSGLSGWEVLFIQFRDKKSGELTILSFTRRSQSSLTFLFSIVYPSNDIAHFSTYRPSYACSIHIAAY